MILRSSIHNRNFESLDLQASMAVLSAVSIQPHGDVADGKRGGIRRSSATRTVLAMASVALLLLAFLGLGSTVTKNFGSKDEQSIRQELEKLARQLGDKEIELAWEKEHLRSQIESQKEMAQDMIGKIQKERENLMAAKKTIKDVALKTHRYGVELSSEQKENEELKQSLAFAMEELAKARAPPPGSRSNPSERKLRASQYQPGDHVELIEPQEGGKMLYPGIVDSINEDGTYDIVKIQQSKTIRHLRKEKDFQAYRVYTKGMRALYEEALGVTVPITIVGFIKGPNGPGSELHGSYQFIDDRDRREVHACEATKIHRLA